ncbi:hypothetical protein OBV_20410 [Oscillibacter valericigenes Sjm18-20]|nr:hypothetical protein OBV_20410 [Oscillibacter valericigenes Sjm18-20]
MKTGIIYFSATGTTKALAEAVSRGLSGNVHFMDVTLPESRKNGIIVDNDLTIIAAPVYGERIPGFLFDFFHRIKGNGTPLAAISVYGNMGFGISLQQYREFAEDNHFRLIAAGVFIGQHTYATKMAPVAYGRPDEYDLQQARRFGESIQKKMDRGDGTPVFLPATVLPRFITAFPDSGIRLLIRQPRVKEAGCISCGVCALKCPMGAIDFRTLKIHEQKCLRCYACVKVCPKAARIAEFRFPMFRSAFNRLGAKRKENQIFL